MNYSEFKTKVIQSSYYLPTHAGQQRQLFDVLSKHLSDNHIQAYYLKNLYIDGEKELYVLDINMRLWKAAYTENKTTKVKCYVNNEYLSLELENKPSDFYYGTKLTIELNNGEVIYLDSKSDAHEGWVEVAADSLIEMYSRIIGGNIGSSSEKLIMESKD